ncbi:MAG: ATP-binding cassette domain-containing protein [Chitinivibrionales bacterium]|nr:ATP-binding cassette domain-containing protein [Chitinivibrionales bacterium]
MITLNAIEKQYGSKILFDGITAAFNPAHRTGLIGPNGAGKTVLMRVLAGKENVDRGSVTVPSDLRLAYLPQEMVFDETVSVLQHALRPFETLLEYEKEIGRLDFSHDSPEYQKNLRRLDELQAQIAVQDIHRCGPRAKSILSGLGVPQESWNGPLTTLSGGFRMRVQLTQLLLVDPDFLMLDEPTNHLDMDSLIWLEKFLGKFSGGMLIISHDRDFLNRTTTHTAELCAGKLVSAKGNVRQFYEWKEQAECTETRRIKNVKDKITQTESFIKRFKAKNTKASQARSKMKQLERLKEQLPAGTPGRTSEARICIPPASRAGSVPVKLERAVIGYENTTVFSNANITITRGDKIAIIGPNGAGKSTLLKTIAGELKLTKGKLTYGHNTQPRYYSQHRSDQLNPSKTLYETIAECAGTTDRNSVLSVLGAFMFSEEESGKTVGVLSGGEKSRVSLASILADPGNMLLLDEPTNHLDIRAVEALGKALKKYNGTLCIVSHDEYFLSLVANRIIEVRPGVLRDFPGSLEEYRTSIELGFMQSLDDCTDCRENERKKPDSTKEERIRKRKDQKQQERKVAKLENSIVDIEREIDAAKSVLHDPGNATDYNKLSDADRTLRKLQETHDRLLHEWERESKVLETEFGFQ